MDLSTFINSEDRTAWITEPGLAYYVRKSLFFPGAIELANCHQIPGGVKGSPHQKFGLWRFLKRYSDTIPFFMEQVLNPDLAQYMRRLKWLERDQGGTPQFASPVAVERYKDTEWFQRIWEIKEMSVPCRFQVLRPAFQTIWTDDHIKVEPEEQLAEWLENQLKFKSFLKVVSVQEVEIQNFPAGPNRFCRYIIYLVILEHTV